jgi:hypothetical protein
MVSRCLSATGISFLVILFPPGNWALLTVGLPTPREGSDLDGVSVFHTHELRSGWEPSLLRGQRCSPWTGVAHRPASAAFSTPCPCTPPRPSIDAGLCLTKHQSTRGSDDFSRPIFPSPDPVGWNDSVWGFKPRASHPAITRSARRGGDRSSSTDLNQRSTSFDPASNHALITQCVRPHVARDKAAAGSLISTRGGP